MLQFLITVSKRRDRRPLDARSLALSTLLGTHPPELPVGALIDLGGLFGIAPGTMRTALSRMLAAGEVAAPSEGRYRLVGPLLDRQRAQDAGRRRPPASWDGTWHSVVSAPDQRQLADRRRFRAAMTNARFGELRPDIWMRPANLAAPTAEPDWIVLTGAAAGLAPDVLVTRLWDLTAIAADAVSLVAELDDLRTSLDWIDPASIPPIFSASAAVVRFLRAEPLLPAELLPARWPPDELRAIYDDVEADFQRLLSDFLRGARASTR